jgi:hypothetical protein
LERFIPQPSLLFPKALFQRLSLMNRVLSILNPTLDNVRKRICSPFSFKGHCQRLAGKDMSLVPLPENQFFGITPKVLWRDRNDSHDVE